MGCLHAPALPFTTPMSPLLSPRLRLKGAAFGANLSLGDLTTSLDLMDQRYATPAVSPSDYKFPDIAAPYASDPPSSPSDSPSTSASALPSLNSSQTSLFSSPDSISLRDLYLPSLSPGEILDTLDHLAATAPKKKSHARKQPAGHIPRPRNAFILFRCLFVSQQAVPASVEKDHRNISRIAGKVWKSMSDEEREPWSRAAELEKNRHEQKWPGYRYNPVQSQALPRRFTPVARGRTMVRDVRPAEELEPPFVAAHPALPPPHDDTDREGRCAQVASLVRSGKQGPALEAAIRAVPSPASFAHYYPPDSPPPPPTPGHMRLATRRSSSCPPLPPLGTFPFNNANPWGAAPYDAAPSPSPSPFAFPFPSSYPPMPAEDVRPLTAPDLHDPSLSARLCRRRGSSLDRTLASSSIAGAFGGGGLPRPNMNMSMEWSEVHYSHRDAYDELGTGTGMGTSEGSGTPALSPSPQSSLSFEGSLYHPGGGASPADEPDVQMYDNSPAPDSPAAYEPEFSPPPPPKPSAAAAAAAATAAPPPHLSPPASLARTIPARLFGSQGARLGLDLDLPLFDAPDSAATPTDSADSAYPYTPASPHHAQQHYGGGGGGYSYTQALMDADPDVGAHEFSTHALSPPHSPPNSISRH